MPASKKKTETDGNATNFLIVALVLSVASIACTRVTEIVRGPTQPEKVRKLNSEVPSGVKNAERVYLRESDFVIELSDSNEILLKNADVEPIAVDVLNTKLAEYLASTPKYDAKIHIKAGADRDPRTLVALFDEIRKHDIYNVNLLVSRRTPEENASDFAAGRDVPEPDSAFEVKVRGEVRPEFKPNPLLLVVSGQRGATSKILLNMDVVRDHDDLRSKLTEIFKTRESNGVFREGTNEVEKTVWVKLDETIGKWGDVIKVVDTMKAAGADPIVLVDNGELSKVVPHAIDLGKPELIEADPLPSKKPRVISGGVLNGRAISLPKAVYPPAARAVRASGQVSVQILIDREGKVASASAVSGHPLLRAAAVEAARGARFEPTLLSAQPVSVSGVLIFTFYPE